MFSIKDRVFASSYELVGQQLIFEISTAKIIQDKMQGVVNLAIINLQRVVLNKKP